MGLTRMLREDMEANGRGREVRGGQSEDVYYLRQQLRDHHARGTHIHRHICRERRPTRGHRQGPAVRGSPQIILGGLVCLLHSEERGPFVGTSSEEDYDKDVTGGERRSLMHPARK